MEEDRGVLDSDFVSLAKAAIQGGDVAANDERRADEREMSV